MEITHHVPIAKHFEFLATDIMHALFKGSASKDKLQFLMRQYVKTV